MDEKIVSRRRLGAPLVAIIVRMTRAQRRALAARARRRRLTVSAHVRDLVQKDFESAAER